MTDNESHALIDLEIMFDYFQKSNDIIGFHKQFDSQKKKVLVLMESHVRFKIRVFCDQKVEVFDLSTVFLIHILYLILNR